MDTHEDHEAHEVRRKAPKSQKRSQKTHVCQEEGCGKFFSRREHLRRHQLNHQRCQTWTCQACLTEFVRRDLWHRHWKVRHPGEKPSIGTSSMRQDNRSKLQLDETTPEISQMESQMLSPSNETEVMAIKNASPIDAAADVHNEMSDLSCAKSGCGDLEGSTPSDFLRGSPIEDDALQNQSLNDSVDMEMNWQDWFADVQPENERSMGVDLSWLFGSFDVENSLHAAPRVIDPLTLASIQYEHPVTLPSHSSANDLAVPTQREFLCQLNNPSCGFRICCALSVYHQKSLLLWLGTEVANIEPSVLTLPSLRYGVHMFFRYLSKEYPILHHQVLAPPNEHRQLLEDYFGLESPPELMWAVITFGWSILDRPEYEIYGQTAQNIQVNLRRKIIAHPLLNFTTPLWLIQTHFLCLAFARYHGSNDEYGFATLFHGVLIDVVRRINLMDQQPRNPNLEFDEERTSHAWFTWIKYQTINRIIFQTLILDIQQALLHGGDVSLSPFSLNLQLPESDDAWFAPTLEQWWRVRESLPTSPPQFLSILKSFWNSSNIMPTPSTFPRGCKVLMYGILAIAYDMRRRDDNSFSEKSLYSLESLGTRVGKSFEKWLLWWNQTYNHPHMETIHLWRNCACIFRLGHTLYEVGTSEWRIMAGNDNIDGKRIGSKEYTRAKRKIKAWTKQDRAHVGLANAAAIIQERLSPFHKPNVHCEHCRWCLYIAGLICWGFGFVTNGTNPQNKIQDARHAREECDAYLAVLTGLRGPCPPHIVNKTTGLILVLEGVIRESYYGEGLVQESLASLQRLLSSSHLNIYNASLSDTR